MKPLLKTLGVIQPFSECWAGLSIRDKGLITDSTVVNELCEREVERINVVNNYCNLLAPWEFFVLLH